MKPTSLVLTVLAVMAMLVSALAGEAGAATLYVQTNGVDAAGCGSASAPCRSISAALEAATDGARIVVGPGRYGDLNGNGVADPGDESLIGPGCNCLIRIDKRVTLESELGAAATVIDGGGGTYTGIRVTADQVVLGRPGKGFTLTQGGNGIVVDDSVVDVTVAGNHVKGHRFSGFVIAGKSHRVTRNLATENVNSGFLLFAAFASDGHVLSGNVAAGNTIGIDIQGAGHVVSGNLATDNAFAGFSLNFGPHTFTGNSAIGNRGVGVTTSILFGTTITKNNIYGNDPAASCGVQNTTGGHVAAHGNFWGAASGPGQDPADQVCDEGSSVTTTSPAATRDFAVNVIKLQ